jgi:hypothetical protein
MRPLFALTLLFILLATPSRAQTTQPGDELTIFLITVERGDAVFEKFAHNTIAIHDASTGTEILYNWGIFDFSQHRFFLNYMVGRMDYSMASEELAPMAAWYEHQNRSMWAAQLNLTPAQRTKLRDYCRHNELPENRVYRYNYFTDNCSTRVRDAIDFAVDGQIKAQLNDRLTDTTFRSHTLRVTRDSPIWCTFFNTALGPATDRRITSWEECFLPILLHRHLRELGITNDAGQRVPLIKQEFSLFKSIRPPEPTSPPNWIAWYFLIGVAVAGAIEGSRRWAIKKRLGRFVFGTVLTLHLLVLSFFALFAMWMWFASSHWAAWRNENLFAYSPIAVPLLLLTPAFIRRSTRYMKPAVNLSLALAASTLLGLIAAPIFPQPTLQPLALVLAPNLTLAWSIRKYTSHPSLITHHSS